MHGFSAKFFTSPLEALAAARAKSPDLLISDVEMPRLSGIDLAIRIKALYPACKILLFSGQPSNLDLLDSARAQGHDFDLFLKPIPPPELLAEIRKRIRSVSDEPWFTVEGGTTAVHHSISGGPASLLRLNEQF